MKSNFANSITVLFLLAIVVFSNATINSSYAFASEQDSDERAKMAQLVSTISSLKLLTPPGVITVVGTDPFELYKFVRDEIRFEAYYGSLRGAKGTLLARSGNAWDQAILLKTLLETINVKSQILRARLPDENAQELLASINKKSRPDGISLSPDDLKRIGLSSALWEAQNKKYRARIKSLVDASVERAQKDTVTLGNSKKDDFIKQILSDTLDYVWVRARINEIDYDFHPAFAVDKKLSMNVLGIFNFAATIPAEFRHWVRLRCVAERVVEDGLERTELFQYKILSAAVADISPHFSLRPELNQDKSKVRLTPTLKLGDLNIPGAPKEFSVGSENNRLGATTAVWLEVTVLQPLHSPRTHTITMIDALPSYRDWQIRNDIYARSGKVASVEELAASVELMIIAGAIDRFASVNSFITTTRRFQGIVRKKGDINPGALSGLSQTNPMLLDWGIILQDALKRCSPDGHVYLDSPNVAAILYRPVTTEAGRKLRTSGGILHLKTVTTNASDINPGAIASRLFQNVAKAHQMAQPAAKDVQTLDSVQMPVKITRENFSENLARKWDWDTLVEVEIELMKRMSVYAHAESASYRWWSFEPGETQPVLRGRSGWMLNLPDSNIPEQWIPYVSGELMRSLVFSGSKNPNPDDMKKAMAVFARWHWHADGISPISSLTEAIYGDRFLDVLTGKTPE